MGSVESPPAPGRINMITLHTDQYADMRRFYSEQLGMTIVSEIGEFVEFASEGIRLTLTSRAGLNTSQHRTPRAKGTEQSAHAD